jgi:hypothetical protein
MRAVLHRVARPVSRQPLEPAMIPGLRGLWPEIADIEAFRPEIAD